jgi:hypothetical protein
MSLCLRLCGAPASCSPRPARPPRLEITPLRDGYDNLWLGEVEKRNETCVYETGTPTKWQRDGFLQSGYLLRYEDASSTQSYQEHQV